MKILLPIKPEYSQKILNGTKTFEYRTKIAKEKIEKIIIYETHPTMKVVGEVDVSGVIELPIEQLWLETEEKSGISKSKFMDYFKNRKNGFAYKLGDFRKYKKPLSLSEFNISFPPQSFVYLR